MLPWLTLKLFHSSIKLRQVSRTFADKLRQEILPSFAAETAQEMSKEITSLDSAVLLERLDFWVRRTLIDFARDSLKPTVLAAVAMGNLERGLRSLGPERTRAALGERSEEHTSELQSHLHLACRLLLEKQKSDPLS